KSGITVITKTFNDRFLQFERPLNITNDENKKISTQYNIVLTKMHSDFENIERPGLLEQLNALPTHISFLAKQERCDMMSADDVSVAVTRYVEVLRKSSTDLAAAYSNPEAVRMKIASNATAYLADTENIGEEIETLLRKAQDRLDAIDTSI